MLKTLCCADLSSRPLCWSFYWRMIWFLCGFEYIAKNPHRVCIARNEVETYFSIQYYAPFQPFQLDMKGIISQYHIIHPGWLDIKCFCTYIYIYISHSFELNEQWSTQSIQKSIYLLHWFQMPEHIEAEPKWLLFYRQDFQINFLEQ